MLAYSATERYC